MKRLCCSLLSGASLMLIMKGKQSSSVLKLKSALVVSGRGPNLGGSWSALSFVVVCGSDSFSFSLVFVSSSLSVLSGPNISAAWEKISLHRCSGGTCWNFTMMLLVSVSLTSTGSYSQSSLSTSDRSPAERLPDPHIVVIGVL